jgi:hypothetical protein
VLLAVAAAMLGAGLLAGCGGTSSSNGGNLPTKRIDITFNGSSVTPNGALVKVAVGQRIELDVTADTPGQIHVHSSPEQELNYDQGSSTLTVKPITAPGSVVIESHALDKVIVKLQVQ